MSKVGGGKFSNQETFGKPEEEDKENDTIDECLDREDDENLEGTAVKIRAPIIAEG